MSKRKMNLSAAQELVPDDLPDGAYFAMLHEFAGAEYGECWHELDEPPKYYDEPKQKQPRVLKCSKCDRKFADDNARQQHMRDAHIRPKQITDFKARTANSTTAPDGEG